MSDNINESLAASVLRLGNECRALADENARLKAEVERYKFTIEEERQIARQDWAGLRCEHDRVKRALEQAETHNETLMTTPCSRLLRAEREEVARLKAEVERLTQEYSDATNHYNKLHNDLEAEVERLRKAGDVTSKRLHWFCQKWGWKDEDLKTLTPEWNAAKEGKPSV